MIISAFKFQVFSCQLLVVVSPYGDEINTDILQKSSFPANKSVLLSSALADTTTKN